jgi:hypothetical protein
VSGWAFGSNPEVGTFLSSRLSLSFELGFPARFESVQQTDHGLVWRDKHRYRDVTYSALFHYQVLGRGRFQLAAIGGPTVVREDDLSRTAFQVEHDIITGNFLPYGNEIHGLRWTVAATGGADVTIRVSRRVQVVPQMRVHVVDRDEFTGRLGSLGSLGLSSVVFRPAVGVRMTF